MLSIFRLSLTGEEARSAAAEFYVNRLLTIFEKIRFALIPTIGLYTNRFSIGFSRDAERKKKVAKDEYLGRLLMPYHPEKREAALEEFAEDMDGSPPTSPDIFRYGRTGSEFKWL